ncbi:MAG: OmpA family protein [Deltaproteobacteria bacterium]|nr:OmpA family protein [Deltaproteobacteria bacterium]
MLKFLVVLFLAVLMSTQAYAGDYGFETTSEGIADALTRPAPEQPVRTRSLTRSFTSATRRIEVVWKDQGKTVQETVVVSEAPTPQSVNLKIEFDTNSYAIRPDSFRLLSELGKALTSDKIKGKTLILKGHTDSDGENAYNLTLSLNRALSIQSYLVGNFQIEPDRIKVVGYGEALALVPNTSAANKQLNRRVEVQAVP